MLLHIYVRTLVVDSITITHFAKFHFILKTKEVTSVQDFCCIKRAPICIIVSHPKTAEQQNNTAVAQPNKAVQDNPICTSDR
jgi:hypothetical protein